MLPFSRVAEVFFEIEKRSGRLEMTDVLAGLFKETSTQEIDKLVYLVQGILAPPYTGIDLGVGERFAIEAIASTTGYPKNEVEKNYKKSGDLGNTVEELIGKRKQRALLTQEMDMVYVYSSLLEVAKTSGTGSQEHKIKKLTEMLNNSTPLEAKYIVRFVVGTLRLGVGDPTILDALSVAHKGDKSLREELERAYNICADLGYVARQFYEDPKLIAKFKVQPFRPLMPALAEREKDPEAIIERLGTCEVEMKYDGFRIQGHKKGDKVELYSRKLEKTTHMFPEIVSAIKKLKVKEIIFEGEALAYNEQKKRYYSFQETMHRKRKHDIGAASEEFPLKLFVFDILYLDGKDLTEQPYQERRKLVEKIFKSDVLKPSESKLVKDADGLEKIFQTALNEGLEGIMAKDLKAPYTAGKRKFAWIKLKKSYGKAVDTIDAVIVGYYLGHGARVEFDFGGLLVAVQNEDNGKLETIAKVGYGFSELEMVELEKMLSKVKTHAPPKNLDHKLEPEFWVEPKYVIEVAFDDITTSSIHTCGMKGEKGYALRFPRLVNIRTDKSVKEITTTNEVIEMVELQRTKTG
ncbi:ATP-dependent DNA ligase [Candidatus Micrarchaeota archaeon]|nr:ATP-dependent DNA ligase [Candidatus Micrarchaeota archaeon]